MQIKEISDNRSFLMGIATLFVLFRHFRTFISPNDYVESLFSLGYCGVDIFFFLSGFGLFFGWKEYDTNISFYKRRFLRLLPTYIVINVIYSLLLGDFNVWHLLFRISGLRFFIGRGYLEWYIPSLFLFYLFFPFIIKQLRLGKVNLLLFFSLFGVLGEIVLIILESHSSLHLFFSRVPVFSLGILGAYFYFKFSSFPLPKWLMFLSIILIFVLFLLEFSFEEDQLWIHGVLWMPFVLIVPGLIMILVYVKSLLPECICKLGEGLGKVSLEMYLFHIVLLSLYKDNMVSFVGSGFNWINIIYYVLLIFFLYLFCLYFQKGLNFCVNKLVK